MRANNKPLKRGSGRPSSLAKRRAGVPKRERVTPTRPTKIVESGVGNIPMTLVKLAKAVASRGKTAKPTASRPPVKSVSSPSKRFPLDPSTKARNAKSAAEGPKIARGKKIGYGAVAAGGASAAVASRVDVSVKQKPAVAPKPKKGDIANKGGRRARYDGSNWVAIK